MNWVSEFELLHADNRAWNSPLFHASFVLIIEEAILQVQLNNRMQ
jgi:hypothetical protein